MNALFPELWLDTEGEASIDLFAGGGGASLGYCMATGRQMDVAINHDAAAMGMHEANHPETLHIKSDVFEVDPKSVMNLIRKERLGFLWASPDCTYHSKARGKKPIRHKNQKRRALAWVVTRWAGQVRPRVIMLENVEEFSDWGPLHAKRKKAPRTVNHANWTQSEVEGKRVEMTDGAVAEPGERVPVEYQELVPNKKKKRHSFRKWVRSLTDMGYQVEWRYLRACDYGSPTIRKRLFLVARCDGAPIVWPSASHGDPKSEGVRSGQLKAWRTAAECIDWSIPMCSIFATKEEAKAFSKKHGVGVPKRPLEPATMQRIARGVKRYVIDNPKPYLVNVPWGRDDQTVPPFLTTLAHGEESPKGGKRRGKGVRSVEEPSSTQPCSNDQAVVAPLTVPLTHQGDRRTPPLDEPMATQTTANRGETVLMAAQLTKFRSGDKGRDLNAPMPTVTSNGHDEGRSHPGGSAPIGLVAAHVMTNRNSAKPFNGADEPTHTIVADGAGLSIVAPVIGGVGGRAGQSPERSVEEPLGTVTAKGDAAVFAPVILRNQTSDRSKPADDPTAPLGTVMACGANHALVAAGLVPRYGEREGQHPRCRSIEDPSPTVVPNGNGATLVAGVTTYYGAKSETDVRGATLDEPLATIPTENRHGVVAGFVGQENGGFYDSGGRGADEPLSTITSNGSGHQPLMGVSLIKQHGTSSAESVEDPLHTINAGGQHHGIAAAYIGRDFGNSVGSSPEDPIGVVTATGNGKASVVAAFMDNYYGTAVGGKVDDPMRTATTHDRFGLVTVKVGNIVRIITDILMRMLQPRELYRAQGFPDSYIIDRRANGKALTKTEQVRMCGNSVCPQVAEALIRANVPELIARPFGPRASANNAALAGVA